MELLAPAGNDECFRAAMISGADAVYLGVGARNARAFAGNFSLDEVKRALDEAHLYGMKIYIALNTLILQKEMEETLQLVDALYAAGADALIVQDRGLAQLIQQNWPDFPLHASTQMSIHSGEGVLAAKKMGFSRVVLARELSLDAIRPIAKQNDAELEVFVHGAMCVSVSGQCLHSSFLGGRSGNRGQCAQPCRLRYQMENDAAAQHRLSMKDLCLLDHIAELKQMGVTSIKIEGRMKPPLYVSQTVRAYRAAIDEVPNRRQGKQALLQVFNRGGFSEGYMHGRDGLIDADYNGHRGLAVGVCTKKGIRLHQNLEKGDVICVELSEDKREYTVREEMGKGEHAFPIKGKSGQIVWRLHSSRQQTETKVFLHEGKRSISAQMHFTAKEGQPCILRLEAAGKAVTCTGDEVQKARTGGLTEEKVCQQLSKLGDTAFECTACTVELEHTQLFLPNSALNALRREAAQALAKAIIQHERTAHGEWELTRKKEMPNAKKPLLIAQCVSVEQAKAAIAAGAHEVYAQPRLWSEETLRQWADFAEGAPCMLSLPPILQPDALAHVKKQMQAIPIEHFHGLVCGNPGIIEAFHSLDIRQYGDYSLNIANPWAANAYKTMGLERITLSPELTLPQIRDIIGYVPQSEIMVYGTLPSMNLLICPMREQNGERCIADCQSGKGLIDRKKEAFTLLPITFTRGNCLVQMLNAHCLDGLKQVSELQACGAAAWRLSFYAEGVDQVKERITAYRQALDGGGVHPLKGATSGHFMRGMRS